MKTTTLFLVAAAALLTSCITANDYRARRNPEMFAKLSPEDQQAVHIGVIHVGMPKDGVFLSWGPPSHISGGKHNGKTVERWSYSYLRAVEVGPYGGSIGVGFVGRHWGFYDPYVLNAPAVGYVPVEGRYVEFVNDRVTGFQERPPQAY